MIAREAFLEQLTDALYHLYEPDRLGRNPLAAFFGLTNRPDTFAALQQILMDGIEALAPAPDAPAGAPAWEVYEPLSYRFVQRLNQEQVARQLGMSVRHLRRKEHAAVEALAAYLWQRHDSEQVAKMWPIGATAGEPPPHSPSVSQELAWLRDTPVERPADLAALLADVLRVAGALAQRHHVRLVAAHPDTLPALPVHEIALSQALLNLFGQMIPYVAHGCVTLTVMLRPAEVVIRSVGEQPDTGHPEGTAPADHSLDVARELVELCGGALSVAYDVRRCVAELTLPGLAGVTVLAIDDNADTLQLVRRYAASSRYNIVTAQDATQAVTVAEELQPSVIVLDVMMPRVDGWRLLAQLRQNPRTADIPVIVCTILPQEDLAALLGAAGFLRKPFTREAFLSALDQQAALRPSSSPPSEQNSG